MNPLVFILVTMLFPILGRATDESCALKLKELLQTKSELYLFDRAPQIMDLFNINCEKNEFGDALTSTEAFVFVHEATHFEDFGVHGSTKQNDFNLYTVNDEHIGNFTLMKNLPAVDELINPYLKERHPQLLKEDSMFMEMHSGYIGGNGDTMASKVIQGMATELNGYTHGAIIQARLQPLISDAISKVMGKNMLSPIL